MITVDHLFYHYPGRPENPVIQDVSFNIEAGEFLAVMGPNGAGKSTLALLIGGILKPDKGTITFKRDTLKKAILFQNPDDQLLNPTVYKELAFGLELAGMEPAGIRKKVDEFSERYSLAELLQENPQMLSGGEKQKIALLSLLITEPDLLILDEPSTFLDDRESRVILDLLFSDFKKNCAALFITFNPHTALKCDNLLFLDKGIAEYYGRPDDVFRKLSTEKEPRIRIPFDIKYGGEYFKNDDSNCF